ncbi:MAG TPA: BrnA antitoxin family protein [Roseomonas sp.]|jgi:uncharacterized protein (DUF4415 family)
MKKVTFKASAKVPEAVSDDLMAALQAVAAMPDDAIDTSDPDAPEVLDWSGSTRGRFYRPVKIQKTLRIDADVVAFYEAQGPGYLTRMNRDLRAAMLRGLRRQRTVHAKKVESA